MEDYREEVILSLSLEAELAIQKTQKRYKTQCDHIMRQGNNASYLDLGMDHIKWYPMKTLISQWSRSTFHKKPTRFVPCSDDFLAGNFTGMRKSSIALWSASSGARRPCSNESSTSPESTGLKQPDPLLSLKAGGAESIPVLNPESESESELNSESEFESESESEPKSESECEQVGICECELNYTKSHHYTLRNHVKPQRN